MCVDVLEVSSFNMCALIPTVMPTPAPTSKPSASPTSRPTVKPTTASPTVKPTVSHSPTRSPTRIPTAAPTYNYNIQTDTNEKFDVSSIVKKNDDKQKTFKFAKTDNFYCRIPVAGLEDSSELDGDTWTGDFFSNNAAKTNKIKFGVYTGIWKVKLKWGYRLLETLYDNGDSDGCPNGFFRRVAVSLTCDPVGSTGAYSFNFTEGSDCKCMCFDTLLLVC